MERTALDLTADAQDIGQAAGRSLRQPLGALHRCCSSRGACFLRLLAEDQVHLRLPSLRDTAQIATSPIVAAGIMPISSTAPFISTSNLRRWTMPATPTCWFSATVACRWRCPTMRRPIGSSTRRLDITCWRFSYNENMIFTEELLRRINPRASVFIINVDDFFDRRETAAAKSILHDPDARKSIRMETFLASVAPTDLRRVAQRFAGRGLLSSDRAKRGPITEFLTTSRSTRRTRSVMTRRSIGCGRRQHRAAPSIFSSASPGEMCDPDPRSLSADENRRR